MKVESDNLRLGVVMRHWRLVYALKSVFEPNRINYTIEAESWNKAHLRALDEREQIANLLRINPKDVVIESITPIADGKEWK